MTERQTIQRSETYHPPSSLRYTLQRLFFYT